MTPVVAARPSSAPVFRTLFPDWSETRPLSLFFMEELLEARRESAFPTNAAEFDEDVNVHLAHLLASLGQGHDPHRALFGSGPQWLAPSKSTGNRSRAQWYLEQGQQRLLYLGLFGWGEGHRRRKTLWGMSDEETRQRDMVCGKVCFEVAANLLKRGSQPSASAEIAAKIARHFSWYVQVLTTLAIGRWGMGAHLSDRQLKDLLLPDSGTAA